MNAAWQLRLLASGLAVVMPILLSSCRSPDASSRTFSFLSGAVRERPLEFLEDEDEMLRAVQDYVPAGTSFVEAQKLMTDAGFDCSFHQDEDGPYLRCYYGRSYAFLVGQQWQVYIKMKDGRADEVVVSVGLVGV